MTNLQRIALNVLFILLLAVSYVQGRKHVALALSSGGFKTMAEDVGMTTGLLAILMKERPELQTHPSPLASSALFGDIDTISSVSAGTWFTCSLAYSETFRIMIEDMARAAASSDVQSHNKTYDIFNSKYSKRFNDLATNSDVDVGEKYFTKAKDTVNSLYNNFFEKNIPDQVEFGLLLTAYIKQNNDGLASWNSIVDTILMMDDVGETMGRNQDNPIQEWSAGKAWAIITAIAPIPNYRQYVWNAECKNSQHIVSNFKQLFKRIKSNSLSYNVEQPKKNTSSFIPARFSIILGSDKSTSAPIPFGPPLLDELKVNYHGDVPNSKRGRRSQSFSATWDQGMSAKLNDQESYYDAPLRGLMGASNAFFGLSSIFSNVACLMELLEFDPSVWFASNLIAEESFDKPTSLIESLSTENELTQDVVDEAARMGLYELTDGGATDSFGIATALAAGATDIFTVNSANTLFPIASHFSGFQDTPFGSIAGKLGKLMKNRNWPFDVLRVFSQDQDFYEDKIKDFEKFNLTHLKENEVQSTSYLSELFFGSMKVITVENTYFGIEKGREVHLHMFGAHGNITMGYNQSFDDYGFYVKDIISTLTSDSNNVITKKMLDVLAGKSIISDDHREL